MRALASAALIVSLAAVPAANAQSSQIQQGLSQNLGSSVATVRTMFSVLDLLGPLATPVTNIWQDLPEGYPLPTQAYAEPALLSREQRDGYERWTVASPAMGRAVGLDVRPGNGGPMVYLLEGIDSPQTSHWVTNGYLQHVFGTEDATVVIPSQAAGSMWQDWRADDPVLGRNKWDTFLTQELPKVVESAVRTNGKHGVIGLSMGGSGAVMMANKHPGFFQGVAAISGCYSTLDPLGRGTVNLTVTNKGGSVSNMWSADDWAANDVTRNPSGLRGTSLYFYVGNGAIDAAGLANYAGRPITEQFAGTMLEAGSNQCTRELSASLDRHGIQHTTVYGNSGAHDWYAFAPQLAPAWAAIKPALQ